ncbi:Type II CAAX prenyl endopeptidase Rce1-like [Dillenia turbinata]|uniref:intramembrane prenyl-peptidase Rce1 n=1 Tax=Dillenia turbinata TaxID=194707 RepID=A0AAN8ZSK7_9MAGN
MEGGGEEGCISKSVAVMASLAMTLFYVFILYAPTAILRLPPPTSPSQFLIRRFICAAISSLVSLLFSSLILPWHAMVFPIILTSLLYAGSLVLKFLSWVTYWKEQRNSSGSLSFNSITDMLQEFPNSVASVASNIMFWRNYVVAPLTEELVFRACMIPLLLCGGFAAYSSIFLCPIFFSLAHLNHLWEYYHQQNCSLLKAFLVAGFQLGYTVIFGTYASFLFLRTGHLVSPLLAHIFCNFMGLPVLFAHRKGVVTMAFVAGMMGFLWFLFPLTNPNLYNDRTDDCRCWHGYCTWKSGVVKEG